MRATQLSDEIWNGLSDLVKRSAPSREVYFAKVVKVDAERRLIYTDQHGPLGIPMLTPEFEADYYDTVAQTVDDSSIGSSIVGAAADNTVATAESGAIVWQKIGNAMVATGAAIARSKLDFGSGLVNADIATAAAIAYAKLALTGGIVNADVNASAAIAASKLASYPSDVDKRLAGDGTWIRNQKITVQSMATGPPASPSTGDIWVATSVDTANITWSFIYKSGDTYPWKFLGGSSNHVYYGSTIQNTSDATWQLNTNAPRFTIPRTGLYEYEWGAVISCNNSQVQYVGVGASAGGIYTPYIYASNGESEGANPNIPLMGSASDKSLGTARTAADVVGVYMYATAHTNTSVNFPWLKITPLAIQ